MDIFQTIFLGAIQGLTEFIPISSSGHLDLLPRLFHWQTPSTAFILFLHLGTLLSLLIYYRKLILRYVRVAVKFLTNRKKLKRKEERDVKVMMRVGISILPAIIIGILLESSISNFYDNSENFELIIALIAVPMIFIGIVFLLEKRLFKNNNKGLDSMENKDALIVGVAQVAAFLRGVSRSGITLLAGQAAGLKRVSAAEFSFLMSIPIITGTSIYSIYKFSKLPAEQIQNEIGLAIVGMITAFIFGLIAVSFLLKYLQTNSLKIFGIYRIIFGGILLALIAFTQL